MKEILAGHKRIAPSKIVCAGRNYREHIEELGNERPENMVFFLKPNSAITSRLCSFHGEPLHYEGELSFLFEKGRFSSVGFGLDLTKRELQTRLKTKGLPWERAKAFDGSALFSPFVEIGGISEHLTFELIVNGRLMQEGSIALMIYRPQDILDEIQSFITLNDGDIVMTGTPKGVGAIHRGDRFEGIVKEKGSIIVRERWTADSHL